jgi:hypothetical protein
MGSSKQLFSIEHEERDGRVSALSYGGVIRVLESSTVPQRFRNGYYALKGSAPPDLKNDQFAARYGCPAGKLCAMCTGRPECTGGPPPAKVELFARMAPGIRTILVKKTVELGVANGHRYLFDKKGDPEIRIPVFDKAVDIDLGAILQEYRLAMNLTRRSIAFHIYQIKLAPEALELAGTLIGVPVWRGRVRLATRRKAS